MKLEIKKGTTSKLVEIFISDSSSTTGAGLAGVLYSDITAYYYRSGAASATAITLATMTLGTWVSGGFIELDATNMPGRYQLGVPDAALATGADQVGIDLKGATNMAYLPLEIQLIDNTEKDIYDIVAHTSYGNAQLTRSATPANLLGINLAGQAGVDLDNAGGTLAKDVEITGFNDIPASDIVSAGAIETLSGAVVIVTDVTNLHASAATITNQDTILARVGDFAGTGLNTVKGFFQALFRSDTGVSGANTPSEVNEAENTITGTFDGATDSVEALRVNTGTAGISLTDQPWNAAWDASVQAKVNDALVAIHLDHLLAVDYDPDLKPGVLTALLNELVESDAGVSVYTVAALANAPSGTGASAATIADAVWDEPKADHVLAASFGEEVQSHALSIDVDTSNVVLAASQPNYAPNTTVPDPAGTAPTVTQITADIDANSTQLAAILGRIGDFAGTGLNTVKGFFQALFRSDSGVSGANAPSEINEAENTIVGTFDGATDSTEAIRNNIGTAGAGLVAIPSGGIKKNTAFTGFKFNMIDAADNISPLPGLTVTAEVAIASAPYVAMTNPVTEVSGGTYIIDPSAADTNGDWVTWKFTAPGARATYVMFKTDL